jgi:TonB family protein
MLRALLLLALALPTLADPLPPAKVGELVRATAVDADELTEALHAGDALARATAARVANVRDAKALLPVLKEALATEKDADAVREELRAIVALGDDADVAAMAKLLPSYPPRMDAAFAEAVARLGGARALDLYVAHVQPLRAIGDRENFFTLALWNHADLATAAASRLLGLQDARGWRELLRAADAGRVAIATEVLGAAMQSSVASIREETLWSIVREHPFRGYAVPEGLQPLFAGARVDATPRELAARELLRRAGGAKLRDNDAVLAWIGTDIAKEDLLPGPSTLLTRRERRRFHGITRDGIAPTDGELPPPDLVVPAPLPAGLAPAVLASHTCEGGWVGTGNVAVDEHGHVTQSVLKKVLGTDACVAALETLLKLSLAEPSSMTSGMIATEIVLVAPESGPPCLDEAPVTSSALPGRAPLFAADVQEAQVATRVSPQFPYDAKQAMYHNDNYRQTVVLEATITAGGCAADLRVVQPSDYEAIDDAALLAVAQWTFKPATRAAAPVDSVSRISVNFQLK